MPSTFSDLKIELMATGEKNTTWGDISNANWDAMEEAVSGSADVVFASADVTLTLLDTNSAQIGRNLRLNLVGTTGGAPRALILGAGMQIEKIYLVRNTCADTITVKNTTGTGVAVAAGQSMFVYNDGVNVSAAVSTLAGGAFTPNFHVKADAGGALVSSPVLMDDGANVGIGTTAPAAKFSVAGAVWPRIGITKDAVATWFMGPAEPSNSWELRLNANPALISATTGSRVGIGTTIPSSTLTVNATYGTPGDPSAGLRVNLNDSTSGLYLSGYNNEAYVAHNAEYIAGTGWVARDTQASIHTLLQGYHLFYGAVGLTPGAAAVIPERMRITAAGDVGVGTTAPETRMHLQAPTWPRIALTKAGVSNWYMGPIDPSNSFALQLNTNAPFLTTNTTGDVGIGIGAATPGAKLEVANTVGVAAFRAVGNASANAGNVALIGITGVTNGYMLSKDAVNNVWHSWSVTGAEAMRLASNGFLGVRNQAPQASLHVAGDFRVGVAAEPNTYNIRIYPYSLVAGVVSYEFRTTDATYGDRCAFDVSPYGQIVVGGRGVGTSNATITLNSGPNLASTLTFTESDAGKSNMFYHPPSMAFYTDTDVHHFRNSAGSVRLTLAPTYSAFANNIMPGADGGASCGTGAFRWSTVYAVNGAINTVSDEREKAWRGPANEAEIRAAGRIIDELGFFQWAEGDDDQFHYGVRAQAVLRIMIDEGLEEPFDFAVPRDVYLPETPTFNYAFITFDSWEESESLPLAPPMATEEDPEPAAPEPTINPAGNRFGLNSSELGLFVATAQHARMNALEARLTAAGI